jgi:SAM-dependent methyltransferase
MADYEGFAEVYDVFMQDTPYDEWTDYIERLWEHFSFKPKLVCDLACGTGSITTRLAERGYDMIGIDLSDSMLTKAREKSPESILYLNQDMREFELFGTVDSIVCLCDSINYITVDEDLLTVFELVNNYLDPGGLFIFDINTIHKFKDILADNCFCETTESSAYTWENYYDEDERINEFYTNFFVEDEESGLYNRFEEYHYERGYEIKEITALLERAGLKLLGVFDELTLTPPTNDSERIYFVAQEITKKKN